MKINTAFWKNKRVLITGHTGFKGSWLIALLNSLGAETHGLALTPSDDRPCLHRLGIRPTGQDLMIDIRDMAAVEKAITSLKPDVVFHLAAQALVLTSYEDPIGTFATNVMGTVHVGMATLKTPSVRVLVNITSDKCYENREWPWAYRENEAMGGHDPYSASKGCAELAASSLRRSFFQSKNVALPSLRAGNVIGGGDWALHRIVPDLMMAFEKNTPAIIRSPRAIRPWQHVLEPLRAYMLVAEAGWDSPQKVSQGWNIGPDPEAARPVAELAAIAAKEWGPEAQFRIEEPADKKHEATYLKLDSSLIRQQIGWKPLFDFKETLATTVRWYRDHANGASAVDLCQTQIADYLKRDATQSL